MPLRSIVCAHPASLVRVEAWGPRLRRTAARAESPARVRSPRVDLDLSPEHELFRDTVRGVRRRAGRTRRRGDRPRGAVPVRARRRDGRARPDGDPVPRGARRRRRRHARVRDRDRGARAHRLVGRDHGRGAHLARHDADLPLRQRGAEAAVAAAARLGRALAAFGLTEPEAGSDAGATRTTASRARRQLGRERLEGVHHERRHRHHRSA